MTSETILKTALIQLQSTRLFETNRPITEELIRGAAASGAQYIQTPENTALMDLRTRSLFENIEPEDQNKALSFYTELAAELKIWLHIGGMVVKLTDQQAANRSFMISPTGAITARYDKIHMFDADLPNGESYKESRNFQPGDKAVLAQLPWGKVGMSICYDLRFPDLYRALAQNGASILAVPAAFTVPTGRAHWRTLLQARAIENGCFVLAAAQGGMHETGRATYGHSLIISPWGDILAEAGEEPCWIHADLDLQQVRKVRQQIPSLQHDRKFAVQSGESA